MGTKLQLSSEKVKNIWKTFCLSGQVKCSKSCASGVKSLKPEDPRIHKILKKDKASMTSASELSNEVTEHCFFPGGTSKQTINRAVRNYMDDGK